MSLSSLSLPQLQAYGRGSFSEGRAEVICSTFSLSNEIPVEKLRQWAGDLLLEANIPLPGMEQRCPVDMAQASSLDRACERIVQVLRQGDCPCALTQVSINGAAWLIAVARPWVFDADGLSRFVHRVLECAQGVVKGADEQSSYLDYVQWQRELMASPEAQFGKQFWTRMALSFRPLCDLRIGERLETVAPWRASFSTLSLEPIFAQRLESIAARLRVSIDALVLSSWLVVLERLLPEETKDLVVVVADSADEGFGDLLGRLGFELPMTFNVADSSPFASLAKHVDKQLEEGGEWKECFFEQHLSIDADRLGARFSTRTLQHFDGQDTSCREHLHPSFAPSSCLEAIFVRGPQPALALCADAACYSQATLDFLLGQLHRTLMRASDDVMASVGQLKTPDALAEQSSVTQVGGSDETAPQSVPERINEVIDQHAQTIAIEYGARSWTYRELGLLVEEQVRTLEQCGVGIEQCVGLTVSDPLRYLVAALAVWRLGAHFVALGENLPQARMQQIIERTGVRVIVDPDGGLRTHGMPMTACAPSQLRPPLHPDLLAYVIFTSGTSGEPRAVAVSHRALANQLAALTRQLPLEPGAIVLGRTTATFDASLWEWMLAFCAGARLLVMGPLEASSERAIIAALEQRPISIVQMTPSLLARCLRVGGADALAKPAHVLVGGEPLDGSLVAAVVERGGTLVNAYGPAETCINASLFRAARDAYPRTVPIGEPLDGYVFYVVDRALRPVPLGSCGMLCIGGAGLARGLVGAPGATAHAFVPDPFSHRPGARMYVTGDLSRRLPNGNIEFVARRDDQLKINGVRIDSAEVLAAIKAERSVRDATLIQLREPAVSLVACVVPVSANHFSVDALNAALRLRLPMSMCPARIIVLDTLALDAHGKVDRRALAAIAQAQLESTYVAPRTPTEVGVAQCWCSVLDVEQVGVHDNFFMNGGHSLSFSRLIVALREKFGISLSLGSVIDAPSIAALAAHIDMQLKPDS